jgi:hypothetical protein
MVARTYNPSTPEAKTGTSQIWDQLHSKTLCEENKKA